MRQLRLSVSPINILFVKIYSPSVNEANFERDGSMNVAGNQGNRPEYMSTLSPLNLSPYPAIEQPHLQFIVSVSLFLVVISAFLNLLKTRVVPSTRCRK